jgi:hypothetical protein
MDKEDVAETSFDSVETLESDSPQKGTDDVAVEYADTSESDGVRYVSTVT